MTGESWGEELTMYMLSCLGGAKKYICILPILHMEMVQADFAIPTFSNIVLQLIYVI